MNKSIINHNNFGITDVPKPWLKGNGKFILLLYFSTHHLSQHVLFLHISLSLRLMLLTTALSSAHFSCIIYLIFNYISSLI